MIDVKSDTWEHVVDHSNEQIERASQALRQRGMTHEDSVFYRGRIDALQEVVDLVKVKPPRTSSPS